MDRAVVNQAASRVSPLRASIPDAGASRGSVCRTTSYAHQGVSAVGRSLGPYRSRQAPFASLSSAASRHLDGRDHRVASDRRQMAVTLRTSTLLRTFRRGAPPPNPGGSLRLRQVSFRRMHAPPQTGAIEATERPSLRVEAAYATTGQALLWKRDMTYTIPVTQISAEHETTPSSELFAGDHGTPAWRSRREPSYRDAFIDLRRQLGDGVAFDYATAAEYGIPRSVISHHQRRGRLWSVGRGLFRFEDQGLPNFFEAAAIVARELGPEAVASHTTALLLHRCTDIEFRNWEFTVPRSRRSRRRKEVRFHTSVHGLPPADVTVIEGVRTTTIVRTILDAVRTVDPYQIEIAVYEGLQAGILDVAELRGRMNAAGTAQWVIKSALQGQGRW